MLDLKAYAIYGINILGNYFSCAYDVHSPTSPPPEPDVTGSKLCVLRYVGVAFSKPYLVELGDRLICRPAYGRRNPANSETPILVASIILPVSIFYTFQTLSYTLDIYRRDLKPTKDF